MRVEVKNFMTYANCVIEPGPKLNLVLGPNGECHSLLSFADHASFPVALRLHPGTTEHATHLELVLTPPPLLPARATLLPRRHGEELVGVRHLRGPGRRHAPAGARRGHV